MYVWIGTLPNEEEREMGCDEQRGDNIKLKNLSKGMILKRTKKDV